MSFAILERPFFGRPKNQSRFFCDQKHQKSWGGFTTPKNLVLKCQSLRNAPRGGLSIFFDNYGWKNWSSRIILTFERQLLRVAPDIPDPKYFVRFAVLKSSKKVFDGNFLADICSAQRIVCDQWWSHSRGPVHFPQREITKWTNPEGLFRSDHHWSHTIPDSVKPFESFCTFFAPKKMAAWFFSARKNRLVV